MLLDDVILVLEKVERQTNKEKKIMEQETDCAFCPNELNVTVKSSRVKKNQLNISVLFPMLDYIDSLTYAINLGKGLVTLPTAFKL